MSLSARLASGWRLCLTGFAHVAFGVGTVLFALFVFLPLRLGVPARARRKRITQWCLGRLLSLFFWITNALGLVRLNFAGLHRIKAESTVVFIANHPSLLDALAILSKLPHCCCVAKDSLRKNPFLRVLIHELGYVTSQEAHHLIDACVTTVKAGNSLLLFPEGTRSQPGTVGEFHRGASSIVLRSGAPLVPLVIECSDVLLPKGARWHQMAPHRVVLTIRACYPIYPQICEGERASSLALTKRLERFFKKQQYGETSRSRKRGQTVHY